MAINTDKIIEVALATKQQFDAGGVHGVQKTVAARVVYLKEWEHEANATLRYVVSVWTDKTGTFVGTEAEVASERSPKQIKKIDGKRWAEAWVDIFGAEKKAEISAKKFNLEAAEWLSDAVMEAFPKGRVF